MSRFIERQFEQLYSGKVAVRTQARKCYLRIPEDVSLKFVEKFTEKDIPKLANKSIVELPPYTTLRCVPERTKILLQDELLKQTNLRFVCVIADVDGKKIEGLLPKSVFHGLQLGRPEWRQGESKRERQRYPRNQGHHGAARGRGHLPERRSG